MPGTVVAPGSSGSSASLRKMRRDFIPPRRCPLTPHPFRVLALACPVTCVGVCFVVCVLACGWARVRVCACVRGCVCVLRSVSPSLVVCGIVRVVGCASALVELVVVAFGCYLAVHTSNPVR